MFVITVARSFYTIVSLELTLEEFTKVTKETSVIIVLKHFSTKEKKSSTCKEYMKPSLVIKRISLFFR